MKHKHDKKCQIDHLLRIGNVCFLALLNANMLSAQDDSPNVVREREYAQLGVEVTDSPGTGVMVTVVSINSPADHSDIRPGDFLLSANGKPIDAPKDFVAVIRQQKPGSELTLGRWRNGQESQVKVVLAAVADVQSQADRAWLGVTLEANGNDGAKIAQVMPVSPAAKAGLTTGDVITAINELPIKSAKELVDAIDRFKANEIVTLTLQGDPPAKRELELGSIKTAPSIFTYRLSAPDLDASLAKPYLPSEHWQEELLDLRRQLEEIRKQLRSIFIDRNNENAQPDADSPAIEGDVVESNPLGISSENGSLRFLMESDYQNTDNQSVPYRQQYQHSYRYYPPAYDEYRYRSPSHFYFRYGPGPYIPYSGNHRVYRYGGEYGPYYRPGVQVYLGPHGFQYYYR